MALTQPEVCRSELRAGCSKTEIAFKTAKRCFRLSVVQSAIESIELFCTSTRRTRPADRLPSSPWQHDRDHPRPRPGLLGSHAKMPCGFQPAGHWGFPRHRVATYCLVGSKPFTTVSLLAQEPCPSVSFCYGREFLSTALPTSMTPPPDPRFSGDWAAAGEKDKARRAE